MFHLYFICCPHTRPRAPGECISAPRSASTFGNGGALVRPPLNLAITRMGGGANGQFVGPMVGQTDGRSPVLLTMSTGRGLTPSMDSSRLPTRTVICERFRPFCSSYRADSLLPRAHLMQSYISALGNFWGPAATLVSQRWWQAAGESPVGSASALRSISTYSLSLRLLSTNPGKPRESAPSFNYFRLSPFRCQGGFFFSSSFFSFFYRRRLPLPSSSSRVGPLWEPLQRVNVSQSCHTVRLGRLLMRGAWRSFFEGRRPRSTCQCLRRRLRCDLFMPVPSVAQMFPPLSAAMPPLMSRHTCGGRRSLDVAAGLQVTGGGGQPPRWDGRVARGKLRRRRLV